MDVAVEGDAFGFHLAHPPLDEPFLHLEVRDAVTQKAAGIGRFFKDMHLMADAGKLLRCGKPSRPRADDCNALARRFLRRLCGDPAFFPGPVDDGAFDGLDRHRRVFEIERAGRLAGRRADAAGELWKVIGGVKIERGLPPIVMIDEIVPVRDLVVHRTASVAIGNAAIHAAPRLPAHIAVLQRNNEFAEMPDAVGGRRIGALLAVDFQKACDFSHEFARLSVGAP